jgi:hypothetical protein
MCHEMLSQPSHFNLLDRTHPVGSYGAVKVGAQHIHVLALQCEAELFGPMYWVPKHLASLNVLLNTTSKF